MGLFLLLWVASPYILAGLGNFLVNQQTLERADAIVVLNSGVDIYPRLEQAAELYNANYAPLVVINGNRKNQTIKDLETRGYRSAAPWDTERRHLLKFLGVKDQHIVSISAIDVYDTISEAQAVFPKLREMNVNKILLVTSSFHTRRADMIWKDVVGDEFKVVSVASDNDGFKPDQWWLQGRQIRWVLAELGGFFMFYKQKFF